MSPLANNCQRAAEWFASISHHARSVRTFVFENVDRLLTEWHQVEHPNTDAMRAIRSPALRKPGLLQRLHHQQRPRHLGKHSGVVNRIPNRFGWRIEVQPQLYAQGVLLERGNVNCFEV